MPAHMVKNLPPVLSGLFEIFLQKRAVVFSVIDVRSAITHD
jgi:hypothetical protein